uniref:Lysyl oxidase like 4 n=1 Tax=Molossus molossus TaxID=27622 RepID=A0A7J8DPZ6_MOLMO|nr:lysyl oxidase like 4 [Molossus molossus]
MVQGRGPFGWTMCAVWAQKAPWTSASLMAGVSVIAATQRTSGWCAIPSATVAIFLRESPMPSGPR